MSNLGLFNTLLRTAEGASGQADVLEERSRVAKQKLAQLDEQLKKGLISPQAYDKLAKAERAALAYLAKPLRRKDTKIRVYSGLLDKAFILAVLALVSTTLLLQYKYGRAKKPLVEN